jgi:hypothetical protein
LLWEILSSHFPEDFSLWIGLGIVSSSYEF